MSLAHVQIFYYRTKHQTIRTYTTEVYAHLQHLFPDPSPDLHSDAYKRGVTLVRSYPISYMHGIQPAFDSVIPILDMGQTMQLHSTDYTQEIDDPELQYLAWEDPINEMLVYEPFLSTSATRVRGRRYSHPMIGDLEDIFHNGSMDVQITYQPQWGRNWLMVPERVKTNVRDLAKWTDELLELRPNYR